MKHHHIFLLVAILIVAIPSSAQHYYAKNGNAELKLINDSNYVLSFFSLFTNEYQLFDTGYYKIDDDILYLTSMPTIPMRLLPDFDTANKVRVNDRIFIVKAYHKTKDGYRMIIEGATNQMYVCNDENVICVPFKIGTNDIIIVHDQKTGAYLRFKPDTEVARSQRYLHPLKSFIAFKQEFAGKVYLDAFPLKMRGNSLIPIDKTKNYDCWLHNGIYFPKMDAKKRTIYLWDYRYRGQLGIIK